jgi:hypothetical protein
MILTHENSLKKVRCRTSQNKTRILKLTLLALLILITSVSFVLHSKTESDLTNLVTTLSGIFYFERAVG